MPTAEAIYTGSVRSLPPEERLRLASLILQDLTEQEAETRAETTTPYTSLAKQAPVLHFRSPRLADAQDEARLQKQVVEEPPGA